MMEDQTRIMDEGTERYPLDPAMAATAETCPHCDATIPVGEQFCPKCGYQRGTWQEGLDEGEGTAASSADDLGGARFVLVSEDGQRYPLQDGDTVIGRGDADIRLADGFISRQHCRFTVSEDSVAVIDLGSANGTFVGGDRISPDAPVELQAGSIVKLGQTELALEPAEPEEPKTETAEELPEMPKDIEGEEAEEEPVTSEEAEDTPGLAPAHLELTPAGSPWSLMRTSTDEVFYLPFGGSRLGRKQEKCDIVVRGDGYISSLHCRLVTGEDHLEVTDLGSTNGTHVNHERVAPDQTVTLEAGDVLRIGQTDLKVVYEAGDAIAEQEPPAEEPEEPPAEE
jgi:pSer/pThr/pTyr-binding forkhead associated (FHA) protein